MPLYPVSLCLSGRLCIIIGSGEVAARKIQSLLASGALVRVIAPHHPYIDGIELIERRYRKGDLEGAALVIAATDDRQVNEEVYQEAIERNIPVNVVDNPPLCTFHVPSVMARGELQISISTGGKCPSLAKKIRHEIEGLYGEEYADYLSIIEEARTEILRTVAQERRKEMIGRILHDSLLFELVKDKKREEARQRAQQVLASLNDGPCTPEPGMKHRATGKVK